MLSVIEMCCLEHRARNYTLSIAVRKRFFQRFFRPRQGALESRSPATNRRQRELISQPSQLLQRSDGGVVWMGIVALRRLERGDSLLHVAEAGAKEAV